MRKFNTIGDEECAWAIDAIRTGCLSGYLGGSMIGGKYVQQLEEEYKAILGVRHAIAVNSATSGLLAAYAACHVGPKSSIITTPYTMSGTVAPAVLLGSGVHFGDIEDKTFCLNRISTPWPDISAVTVVNLFGHPAELQAWRKNCYEWGVYLIEDNAQAPFAMEEGKYAGCVGHIGVFSLNVHKHIHAGEGGICVTNDDTLAHRMRLFRNHGELAGDIRVGLNLRMTEVTAAIALAQLRKMPMIISSRVELAEEIIHMVKDFPSIRPPIRREGCKHVYYCLALQIAHDRDWFVRMMRDKGVPLNRGYVRPLYEFPAFARYKAPCPVTESVESKMAIFEICAWNPTSSERKRMKEAFETVGESLERHEAA